jgi:tetratricopeptide (TPR) repeat protein
LAILSYFVKPLFPFGFLLFSMTTAVITCERLRKTGSEVGTPSFLLSILRKIGLWSYSLYLLHMPLLSICSYAFGWFVPAEYRSVPLVFSFLLMTWLMIIPFSILWYRIFELPGVALGKRIIRSMQIRRGGGVDPGVSPRTANILALKGSHYLMSCALLALVVATFWANAKFTPLQPEEHNNLGLAHVKNGQFNEAILQFREAIRVKPGLASAHNNLGYALAMAGQLDEAIGQFQEAIRLDQDNVEAHFNLGVAFIRREQFIEAISQFQEAIRLNPDVVDSNNNFCFIVALNNRSWSLATSADAKKRDGELALKLAQRACEATHYQKTVMVGTLAAAYAEAGQFAEAISTAQKACALAEKNGEADLLQKNQELLVLYQNHQPYRDRTAVTNE